MKKLFANMKIHNKMMVSFLVVCLVPVLGISMLIYNFSAKNLEEASMEFAAIFNSQIVSNLDNFIEEYDRITKSMLVDEEVISGMEKGNLPIIEQIDQQVYMRKVMMRLVTLKPEIGGIAMLSEHGDFYQLNQDNASMKANEIKHQSWYQDALKSAEALYITEAHNCSYYDQQKDKVVVTIIRKIFDYAGKYVGMVLIDMEPSKLVELNEDFLLARNNYNIIVSVTNEEEKILYDSEVLSGMITWENAMRKDTVLHNRNQEDFLVLSNDTENGNLKVNAIIPKSSLLMKIDKIHYVMIIGLVGCMCLVGIASWLLSRTLSKPMQKLQKSMKKVEEGNYQAIIQGEGEDEIGSLIKSYNNMVRQIRILIEEVYLAEIKQKKAEYLALQTQINPHMLYNTLESIRMNALIEGDDKTADMIKILSKMFRMALDRKKSIGTIQDEVEYTQIYTQLLRIRYKERVSLEIDIPEEMRCHPMVSLIFQPIVENCIEHGFRNRNMTLHIWIHGEFLETDDIQIQIIDDGCGMSSERMKEINQRICLSDDSQITVIDESEKNSIGLRNIAERLRLHYGKNGRLKIISSNYTGTIIEIRIPAKS